LAVTGVVCQPRPTVLVTGATGRTGAQTYNDLKARGVNVRALVRNTSKARERLHCDKCDESEGIFVGDITKKASLVPAMEGVNRLVILTSSAPVCKGTYSPDNCTFPAGQWPVDVDFNGQKNQISAFAEAQHGPLSFAKVVLCSTMGTTQPEKGNAKQAMGYIGFYKLNAEAALMASGIPFTIVKPGGLWDHPGNATELVVGQDDELLHTLKEPMVARADVARVMAAAVLAGVESNDLRFDLCSQEGKPQQDLNKLFRAARNPGGTAASPVLV